MSKKGKYNNPLVIGEELHTSHGEMVLVLSTFYEDGFYQAWVEFQDDTKYVISVRSNNLLRGVLYNPYRKSVWGVGYFGEGIYTSKDEEHIRAYQAWRLMLARAYNPKRKANPKSTYKVCTAWHNYQVFAEWYIANCSAKGERTLFILDDLGNSTYLYSQATCYLSNKPVAVVKA